MIALDSSQTFSFSLDVEARTEPPTRRTVFTSRFPTARQAADIDRLTDEAGGKPADEEKRLLLEAIVVTGVVMKRAAADHLAPAPGEFSLDIDAGKADARLFHVLSLAPDQRKKMQDLVDAASGMAPGKSAELRIEAITLGVKGPLTGIEHATLGELAEIAGKALQIGRLAAAATLADLDRVDLWDVVLKVIRLSGLTENERKKSALRLAAAATRRSALSAAPAGA